MHACKCVLKYMLCSLCVGEHVYCLCRDEMSMGGWACSQDAPSKRLLRTSVLLKIQNRSHFLRSAQIDKGVCDFFFFFLSKSLVVVCVCVCV